MVDFVIVLPVCFCVSVLCMVCVVCLLVLCLFVLYVVCLCCTCVCLFVFGLKLGFSNSASMCQAKKVNVRSTTCTGVNMFLKSRG